MASQYLHNNFITGIAALLLLICAASTIRAQTPTTELIHLCLNQQNPTRW